MSVVANLTAMLTANTSRFEAPMKKAASITDSLNGKMKGLGGAVNSVGGLLVGGAFAIGLKSTINKMDDMVKAADRIGISVESLSKMAYAGELADVSMEELEKTISKMQRSIVEANDGVVTYTDAFDKLGLKAQDFVNKSPEDAMLGIIDALIKMENPTKRNAVALDIFGRSGLKLINFAADGSKGLKELYEEAERLGLVFKDETARAAERLNDNLTRLNQSIQGVFIQASDTGALDVMAEGLTALLNVIVEVTAAYGDLLRALGADIGAGDEIRRVQEQTEKQIRIYREWLTVAEKQGASKSTIAKTTAEIERLEKVAENASKYFDESGNLVKPRGAQAKSEKFVDKKAAAKAEKDALKAEKDLQEELGKIYEDTRTPLEKYNSEVERLNELRAQLGEETYTRAIKKAGEDYEKLLEKTNKLDDAAKDLGMTFSSAFEDATVEGKKFSDVLRGLAQDLLRIATRRFVTEPISNAASGLFSSVGGSLLSGLTGSLSQSFGFATSPAGTYGPFPAFADGGMPPVGRMSVVGERGPELFVPSTRGTIIPNDALGGSQNIYNIDATGADKSAVLRLEQALLSLAGAGVIEQRVNNAMARGIIK